MLPVQLKDALGPLELGRKVVASAIVDPVGVVDSEGMPPCDYLYRVYFMTFKRGIHLHRVHVRGTPTSGKTVLSRLFYTHILEQKEYIPIYITWQLPGSEHRSDGMNWLSYLCKKGLIPEGSFWHQHKTIFILDEAKLSYQETLF
ncbi:hypothetical protein V8E54_006717 [Elaphomyces granulatus]